MEFYRPRRATMKQRHFAPCVCRISLAHHDGKQLPSCLPFRLRRSILERLACLKLAHQTVCHSDQAPLAVSSLRHWAGMFQPASTCRVRWLQGLARHEGVLLFRSLPTTIARLPAVAPSIVCNIFRENALPCGNGYLPGSPHTRSDWAVRTELCSGGPEQKLSKG